jgi:hypothetical protein
MSLEFLLFRKILDFGVYRKYAKNHEIDPKFYENHEYVVRQMNIY